MRLMYIETYCLNINIKVNGKKSSDTNKIIGFYTFAYFVDKHTGNKWRFR